MCVTVCIWSSQLLLVGCTTQVQIEAECNKDVTLPCRSEEGDVADMKFLSLTWYKVGCSPQAFRCK